MNTKAIENLEALKKAIIPHGQWINHNVCGSDKGDPGCVGQHLLDVLGIARGNGVVASCRTGEYIALQGDDRYMTIGPWNDRQKSVWPILARINKAIVQLRSEP